MTAARRFVCGALVAAACAWGPAGCASDPPGPVDFLELSAPVRSSEYHATTFGRTIAVEARLRLGGASLAALRVVVVGPDGKPAAAPPTVVALGPSVPPYAATVEGGATTLAFAAPIADESTLRVEATVPEGAAEPFSLRLEPIVAR
jgi:hypothetical protein